VNHSSLTLPTTKRDEQGEQRGERDTRLQGRRLVLTRFVWIAVVVFNLAFIVASVPALSATLHSGCATAACHALIASYTVKQIQAAGLSVNFLVTYIYATYVFVSLTYLTIGVAIFWLKSHDSMALYTSFALVAFAASNELAKGFVPAWLLPIQIITFFGGVFLGTLFYLFPNGRFVPRWTRWLIVGWVVWWGVDSFLGNSPLDNLLFTFLLPCLFVSVLVAQVYRYRRVSSQVERQQIKWVVFGVSIFVVGSLAVNLLYYINVLSLFQQSLRGDMVAATAIGLFQLLIPLSIAFAILRSRLWDIDVIINRTLVYGSLTALLVVLYVGLILALQSLVRAVTGSISQQPLVLVASTLVIAALFQPLRRRLQNVIDRHFYRRKYDARRTIANFSATLRGEVDLTELSERLVAVVEETMQPAHVSLWLRQSDQSQTIPYKEK
jgi:hypothetical protein